MSCDAVQKLIPLYYYGELTPEEEDQVEAHLFDCAGCARETERQRSLAASLDGRRIEPPPHLIEECRASLMRAIQAGAPVPKAPARRAWSLFLEAMSETVSGLGRLRRPLTAVALLAAGFAAAHIPGWPGAAEAPASDPAFATVRSVIADASGRIRITYDQIERRVISGPMDNRNVRRLLVAGLRDENPDVRVQAVDLLKQGAASADVREALLNRLASDPNAGVRLKALEGLKSVSADPEVRRTLAQVLLADDNPAVRLQAVDLLITQHDDSMVGVLQHLVQKEDNNYVRARCEKTLEEMNASVGTF